MRPRELTMRGFRSYAEEVTFDFRGRSLIGIVGPIGSGKSSVLDAVSFALYGKTPRIGSDTKSLINQRRDSLHVALTFEVDGAVWRVVRSLRRGGASAHALYRVEDGEEREVADRARDVNTAIESVLGLDFEAFRRSVLLAQNQFAEFLEATPVQRGSVLKGVFGFDRLDAMRDVTKTRLDAVRGSLHVLTERRASADADRASLPSKQEALAAATDRADGLRDLRSAVGQVDEVIRGIEERAARAGAGLESLDGIAGSIPARESADDVLAEVSAAQEAESASTAALQETAVAAAAAREAHAAALDAVGGQKALDEAADLVGRLDSARAAADAERARLAEAEAAAARAAAVAAAAQEARAAAAEAAERAASGAAEAGAAEEEARRSVHEAHTSDRARSLRADLAAGDRCPVCEQVVAVVPALGAGVALDDLQEALEGASLAAVASRESEASARVAAARAEADAETAAERLAESRSRLESLVAALDQADGAVVGLASGVAERLGDGEPGERLAALRAGVAATAEARASAAEAEAEARRAVEEGRLRRDTARTGLDRVRSALDKLAGSLGVDISVGDTAESVQAALRAVREEWLVRRAAAADEQERCREEAAAAQLQRTTLLREAGLEPADDLVEVLTEADRAVTALATEVELIEKRLAELDRLDEDEAGLVKRAALLERLHADLRPSGFLEYVLGERRRALADLAGDHLEALTAGRYRFSEDDEFFMLDLSAAEGRRAPASLSGGETFLASLALALALAEIVGRQGGRLDAFFLDEGFGSLDPEHIDLAMEGVERLVTGGPDRLVVVVSHVEAMRDRIEDLIVLSRHPITDHTVVESRAGR